jgi:FAD/FMN-containing dehydrogenase
VEYGFLSDHVVEFELITPLGESMTCSPEQNPEVFHGVLGGQGQLGVITSAQIRTIARKQVYMRMDIADIDGPEHLLAVIERTHERRWNYFFGDVFLEDGRLKLVYIAGRDSKVDNDMASFDGEFDDVIRTSSVTVRDAHLVRWKYNRSICPVGYSLPTILTKYWISNEYCINASAFPEVLPHLLAALELPQSSIFLYDMATVPRIGREYHTFLPYRSGEEGEDYVLYFGVFFTGWGMGAAQIEARKRVIDEIFATIVEAGGQLYLEGYQPPLTRAVLDKLYPRYEQFLQLKARLDPNNIFHPTGIEAAQS